ncbi:MAG: glucodextranase DOMON-like domain-containing protein [Caldisericaceae bacterium]
MKHYARTFIIFAVCIAILMPFLATGCSVGEKPLNVVIVWNNHQPYYKDPISGTYILPWVRLHGAKDYARMPEIVSNYPDVKVTFNLSGSLIEQLKDYEKGAVDRNLQLSLKAATSLTTDEKFEMLQIPGGFFDINWDHILKKTPLFNSILSKRDEAFKLYGTPLDKTKLVNYLSNQDYLDLQTLFNLLWIDSEYINNNTQLKQLYNRAINSEHFTEGDKKSVLDTQESIIKGVFAVYSKLLNTKQIELVTTPYAHPISALLVDFGLNDELAKQIQKGLSLFENEFGTKPSGVWAPECALNDEVLKIFSQNGWKWTISDSDNLDKLGIDVSASPLQKYVPYNVDGVTVFFRDKYLSDGISFRYSGKSVDESLKDVEQTLLDLEKQNTDGKLVYTIALDGENAWEYYENDGNDFLNGFYGKLSDLQKQGKIRILTPSEYISKYGTGSEVQTHKVTVLNLKGKDISKVNSYSNLPTSEIDGQFGESSWVNPTLDTWIGEPQENIAWMWLLDAINKYNDKSASLDANTRSLIEDNLLKAEGSDWFWWYGSDQSSGNDPSFDRLFKLYLNEAYSLMGESVPNYLFGNFFPDGAPYTSESVSLTENKSLNLPLLLTGASGTIVYSKNVLKISLANVPQGTVIGVFNGKSINPYFKEESQPKAFVFDPFPYESQSIGVPIDFEIYPGSKNTFSIDTAGLDVNNLFIALAAFKNGSLIRVSQPIQIRLPIKISGNVIGELYDEEGDDNGTGTYTYPLNDIFKGKGHLFDLVSFLMMDSGENYILQFKMGSIGGNPWNGPSGMSFQIIEAYFDLKDGGLTTSIDPKGPIVSFDPAHSWDVALRIAGWSYGNYITFSDGKAVQGELGIQVDDASSTITVSVPKKYLTIDGSYKPYVAVISGSQDGYGAGYFRAVNATASEWAGGGANVDAINAGVAPKVYDIFEPKGKTQQEILTSYDSTKSTMAVIPFLPLEKAKEVPKIVGTVSLSVPKITPPQTKFNVVFNLKNIGKATQNDNSGNEFTLTLPNFVDIKAMSASSGKLNRNAEHIEWNGSIEAGKSVAISLEAQLAKDVPNGLSVNFDGDIRYDGEGTLTNSDEAKINGGFTVSYPVTIGIPFNENYFLRNSVKILYSKDGTLKSEYVEQWKDLSVPLEQLISAIGGTYEFDASAKKITIVFMGNKYEHWIGQNKALLNGTAIPLVPGNSDIRSSLENGSLKIPLQAIAFAFKFKYNIQTADKIAYLYYLP